MKKVNHKKHQPFIKFVSKSKNVSIKTLSLIIQVQPTLNNLDIV